MNILITPPKIDKIVLDFCKTISSTPPFYVEVKVEDYARPIHCFPNVEEKINRDQGSIVMGWQIWTWPEKFIEAEFHSIWRSPAGQYVDITPKQNLSDWTLFLPDLSRSYNGSQVNNIRQPLSENGLITDFFLAFDALFALQNFKDRANKSLIVRSDEEIEIIGWLRRWQMDLQRMILEGLNKNSRCPCRSGKKYKKCCGASFAEGIDELKRRYDF